MGGYVDLIDETETLLAMIDVNRPDTTINVIFEPPIEPLFTHRHSILQRE